MARQRAVCSSSEADTSSMARSTCAPDARCGARSRSVCRQKRLIRSRARSMECSRVATSATRRRAALASSPSLSTRTFSRESDGSRVGSILWPVSSEMRCQWRALRPGARSVRSSGMKPRTAPTTSRAASTQVSAGEKSAASAATLWRWRSRREMRLSSCSHLPMASSSAGTSTSMTGPSRARACACTTADARRQRAASARWSAAVCSSASNWVCGHPKMASRSLTTSDALVTSAMRASTSSAVAAIFSAESSMASEWPRTTLTAAITASISVCTSSRCRRSAS
mmetsp:Transcript_17433/g.54246  ORF Transcript_17433/g.54246 Transcript_17433/m.54246 type:complete len:284 (-) Transcript_17433:569-1420(-)